MYKPMLANVFEKKEKTITFPCFAQPKLDGVRLCWDGNHMWSRKGKLLQGLPQLKRLLQRGFKGVSLDGELFAEGMHFQDIISSVRRTVNINENTDIGYWLYDKPVEGLIFDRRLTMLRRQFKQAAKKMTMDRFKIVNTIVCLNKDELLKARDDFIAQGFEGCMYRSFDGDYKHGRRSNDLLKMKYTKEIEGKVIGYVEGTGKYKGTLGAIRVEISTAKIDYEQRQDSVNIISIEVGTGFTDNRRHNIWKSRSEYLNAVVTIKYQEETKDGLLRFPVFKEFRDYE